MKKVDHFKRNMVCLMLGCVVIITLIAIAFVVFSNENKKRITEQNMQYMMDNTRQLAARVDSLTVQGFDYIRLVSSFYSTTKNEQDVDEALLRQMTEQTSFDYLEFVDSTGMSHMTNGKTRDVKEHHYYLDGIQGNTGMEVVFPSDAGKQTHLIFYAPVMSEGRISGVLLGISEKQTEMDALLNATSFDEKIQTYLCKGDGRIIDSNTVLDVGRELMLSDLFFEDETIMDRIQRARLEGETESFVYGNSGILVAMSPLLQSDWFIIQLFPDNVQQKMITNANQTGVYLECFLIGVFFLAMIIIWLFYKSERADMEEEAVKTQKYKDAVLSGSMIIFESDLTDNRILGGAWRNADYRPLPLEEQLGITLPCAYDEYISRWIDRFVAPESRNLFFDMTDRNYLLKAYTNATSEISFDYKAINDAGEEYFANRHILLTEDKKTGHVIAHTNVKDTTDQKRQEFHRHLYEKLLLGVSKKLCPGLVQIDLSDFRATFFSFDANRDVVKDLGDWMTWLDGQDLYVHPEDYGKLKEQISDTRLLRMEIGEFHRFDFRGADTNKDGVVKKYTTFIYKLEVDKKPYVITVTVEQKQL